MIHDEEFDLYWVDPAPSWAENIGPIMEIWGNPIFQRRYVLWRLMPFFGVKKSFLIGAGISLVMNLLFRFSDPDQAMGLSFLVTIVVPGIVIFSITGLRFMLSCLIGTPMELRRELFSGMLGAVLASPIPDAKIYFAECVSGLLRGLGALEEILALTAGLVLPFLLVHSPAIIAYVKELGIETVWWVVLFIMIGGILIVLNVMTALAAGLYAVQLPVVATVPATVLHVFISTMGSFFLMFWVFGLFSRFEFVSHLEVLPVLLLAALFMLIILIVETALTGHLGVMAFATARRPGFYEPERASSATFFLREGGDDTSYGHRV